MKRAKCSHLPVHPLWWWVCVLRPLWPLSESEGLVLEGRRGSRGGEDDGVVEGNGERKSHFGSNGVMRGGQDNTINANVCLGSFWRKIRRAAECSLEASQPSVRPPPVFNDPQHLTRAHLSKLALSHTHIHTLTHVSILSFL